MSTDAPRPENPELLAAIIAHPDEDTPRLMYADWLQENGDLARAEFIRLHVEWDSRPPYAPPDDDLKRRLVAAFEAAEPTEQWADRCRRWGRYHAYERGFVAAVAFVDGRELSELAAGPLAAAPVRVLYANESNYNYARRDPDYRNRFLIAARSMRAVSGFGTELDHNSGLSAHWADYLTMPQAAGLRVLDLNYSRGEESCPLVARLTNLTGLLALDLTVCCRLDDRCLAHLTGAAHLRSLVALRLAADDDHRGAITEAGIARLVESPYLTNLRQLTLNNHEDLNNAAVRRLLEWEHVGRLEVLELSCRDITDAGVIALARAPELRNLRRLVLDGSRLESETVAAVLDSRHLRGLAELYLSPPPVSMSVELIHRLRERFPHYANMRFDPPAVCPEDRIRARYRLMTHPCGDGTYRGRDQAHDDTGGHNEPPLFPEYAIL